MLAMTSADRAEHPPTQAGSAPVARLIRNRAALLGVGDRALREAALGITEAAIRSADPAIALRQALRLDGSVMQIGARRIDLAGRRVFVVGAGKATLPIAEVLDAELGTRITDGLVVLKSPPPKPLLHVRTFVASHPVPDERSVDAAEQAIALLGRTRPGDIVLACFTGGSSALFCAPAPGITLADKIAATRLLLNAGASIVEINAVRKHMSRVKGGRLARYIAPGAVLVNLTVSDVVGDRMDCITDPTVPDLSSFADASSTLDAYGLWDRFPASIAVHLRRAAPEHETCRDADFAHLERLDLLLLRADAACAGAVAAAERAGFRPILLSTFFEGDSVQLARHFGAIVRQVLCDGNPAPRPCALIGGGETTVRIDAAHGLGGPNQEFVLRLALDLDGVEGVAAVGVDTDGTDGPTDFAGAIADGTTAGALRRLGIDPRESLARHDATAALWQSGHLIETGETGTNVNDLKLVLIR
jgi:glycerate-2-kinase